MPPHELAYRRLHDLVDEDLVGKGQNDYQEGMVAHPGKLAGVAHAEHVEVPRDKGDGRREIERGGDAQDFASCVHAGADSSHSSSATAATFSAVTRVMQR